MWLNVCELVIMLLHEGGWGRGLKRNEEHGVEVVGCGTK